MKRKVTKKENRKGKPYKWYSACMIALVLLFIIAFWGPQFIFGLQDTYQSGGTWQGVRDSLEIGAVYNAEGSLRNRLVDFADGLADGRKYKVAGTDYQVTDEVVEIFAEIFEKEYMLFPLMMGVLPDMAADSDYDGLEVESWEKYIIYSDEILEDASIISFTMWYIEIVISEELKMKLLVDTESYELYYMQVTAGQENFFRMEWSDFREYLFEVDREYLWSYWYEYYGAGSDDPAAENFLVMMNKSGKTATSVNRDSWMGMDYQFYETEDEEPRMIALMLKFPYNENDLQWEIGVRQYEETVRQNEFFMGIKEIAEMIPGLQSR